jgi:hypothetical protein
MKSLKMIIVLSMLFSISGCGKNNSDKKNDNINAAEKKIENQYIEGSKKRVVDSENRELPEVQLMLAIAYKSEKEILSEMDKVEDVNFIFSTGDSPLSWAAFFLKEKTVAALFKKGFLIDDQLESMETNPITALMMSIYADADYAQERVKLVYETLLANGALLGQVSINPNQSQMGTKGLFWYAFTKDLYDVCLDYLKENKLTSDDIDDVWMSLDSYQLNAKYKKVEDYHKVIIEAVQQTDIQKPIFRSSPEVSHREYLLSTRSRILKHMKNKKERNEVKALFKTLLKIVKEKE